MLAQEIKESLRTLTPAELLELKRSVDELCAPLQSAGPASDRDARIAIAKREIFTEYDSLLSELAK
jgi:hypothetical protein